MVVIGSIDFSDSTDLYEAIKTDVSNDKKRNKYMFFDDDDNIKNKDEKDKEKKLWIVWWNKNLSI